MNKHELKGEMHKTKGKVKEVAGRAVGNDEIAREGEREQARGTLQKAWGNLKKKFKRAVG